MKNLHPYTRALFESVISRTFNLGSVEPPNLTVRNKSACSYAQICDWKPDDKSICESSFIKEYDMGNNSYMRCVRAEHGIDF